MTGIWYLDCILTLVFVFCCYIIAEAIFYWIE